MAATEYTHPLTDFLNDKVDIPRLTQEIDDSEIVIKLSNDGISVVGTDCHIWFMSALDGDDRSRLDTIVANHSGEPLPSEDLPVELKNVRTDSDKNLTTASYPRELGETRIIYTPNFSDKTTWWYGSERVEGETLTPNSGTEYGSANANWIDITHGKLSHEGESGVITDPSSYLPIVYVDGEEKTEREPFSDTGGDYEIDYATGVVTFFESQAGKAVTADYSYASSSLFVFGPSAGKMLMIEKSEIQYSDDVQMNGTFHYAPFAYNPQNPAGPKVQAAAAHVYKTLKDFVVEANGVYPIHPACPNPNGRGMATAHINAPFDYGTVRTIRSSQGVEIRIWMSPDNACGGEFAEMTFYCMEFDEA